MWWYDPGDRKDLFTYKCSCCSLMAVVYCLCFVIILSIVCLPVQIVFFFFFIVLVPLLVPTYQFCTDIIETGGMSTVSKKWYPEKYSLLTIKYNKRIHLYIIPYLKLTIIKLKYTPAAQSILFSHNLAKKTVGLQQSKKNWKN